jgi:hypothetical protein
MSDQSKNRGAGQQSGGWSEEDRKMGQQNQKSGQNRQQGWDSDLGRKGQQNQQGQTGQQGGQMDRDMSRPGEQEESVLSDEENFISGMDEEEEDDRGSGAI